MSKHPITGFLTAPFPFVRNPRIETLALIVVAIFVSGFLLVFEPFGTQNFQSDSRELFLSGYGAIILLVGLLFRFALPLVARNTFDEERWTVGKHAIWFLALFLAALSCCYLYWGWYFEESLSLFGLLGFSLFGVSIGVFPILGIITLEYIARLKKYQSLAQQVELDLNRKTGSVAGEPEQSDLIQLKGELNEEYLSLNKAELLFLRSAGNYVEIHYETAGVAKSTLFRARLKELEAQISSPDVLRCHRSYIVNLTRVKRISGNAQGYRLHLDLGDLSIPVSRAYSAQVLKSLQSS